MKLLRIIPFLVLASGLHAETLSSCHKGCYNAKHNCNIRKSHTFNTCHDELFSCKASCSSGKKQALYDSTPPVEVAFTPILDFDILDLLH